MTVPVLLDSAGRRRSPATMPGYHAGRAPRNKGQLYPADPPTVEEIVAVMRLTGEHRHGWRLRAMIVVLWRAGLRIHEALALAELDLDPRRGSLLVRNGKGGKRREVGMDEWGWEQLRPWLIARAELPVGPLFCIIDGPTRGRPWASAGVRRELRRLGTRAGVRRRFAPHQLRHAHALELAREGVPLNIIQRQLGHANLGTTSIYLQGIDPEEIIGAVRARRAPMMSASAGSSSEQRSLDDGGSAPVAPASPGRKQASAPRPQRSRPSCGAGVCRPSSETLAGRGVPHRPRRASAMSFQAPDRPITAIVRA
jgi:integrase